LQSLQYEEKKRVKIFGEDIEKVMAMSIHQEETIPLVCKHILNYLAIETRRLPCKYGLYKDGLFRQCGSQKTMDSLIERYECNKIKPSYNPFLEEPINTHVAGSLLKHYLRNLPEPLIPELYESMLINHVHTMKEATTESEQLEQDVITRKFVKNIISFLPDIHKKLLNLICYVLCWTDTLNAKMKADQLSRIFCQVIMDKSRVSMGDLQAKVYITKFIISHYMDIFNTSCFRDEIAKFFPDSFINPSQLPFVHLPVAVLPRSSCRMSISTQRQSMSSSSPIIMDHPINLVLTPTTNVFTSSSPVRRCTPQTPKHTFYRDWYLYTETV